MYASRQIGSRPARVRRKRLGDGIDWGSILNNTISTAGKVAAIAETPTPTTSVMYPSGALVTSSGGAALPALSDVTSGGTGTLLLVGGFAVVLFLLMSSGPR